MSVKQVATNLHTDLIAEIDAIADSRYTTRSEILREAVLEYLDRVVPVKGSAGVVAEKAVAA